jgi:hypothetical protein
MMLRRAFLFAMAGAVALPALAQPSPAEAARIERLIQFVESKADIKFIRNGSEYSCTDAGKFLRGKLDHMGKNLHTAQEFIDQIASKSSTSGEPYLIRHADGRVMPAAKFLGDELKRMGR